LKDSGEGLSEVQYTWQDNITPGQVSIAYLILDKEDSLMRDNQAKNKNLAARHSKSPHERGVKQHIET
jgi:hypothetical protein